MLSWIMAKWRAWQRAHDLAILWPSCIEQAVAKAREEGAPDEDGVNDARATFIAHVWHDKAWTEDFSRGEILSILHVLEPEDRSEAAIRQKIAV